MAKFTAVVNSGFIMAGLYNRSILSTRCGSYERNGLHRWGGPPMKSQFHYTFRPIKENDRALIENWLTKAYVAKWFYGDGLTNTLRGIDEFIKGQSDTKYWLACDGSQPFAFLITSLVKKPKDELTKWCIAKGTTITLDMLIGEENYLGKKLSHIVIKEFLLIEFPQAEEVLIDPEASNSRAVHVYEKVGFKILDEFIPPHSPHPHYIVV